MRIRILGTLMVLCALTLAPVVANRAEAQSQVAEKPVLYTYVSEWAIPRAMWSDYLKSEAEDQGMLKKAVADGALISYGSYEVLNHQEGLPTHGTWFQASTMAGILTFLEVLRKTPGATSAPFAAAKHWDYILDSRNYGAHSGTFTNGYLRVGRWSAKEGSGDGAGQIRKATIVALCEKLMADGALHSWEIDEESVHSQNPGTIFIALVTNGPEGVDKFDQYVEEAEKKDPASWAGFSGTISQAGHTDFLARVTTMNHK
jgi:hypothetical protein